VICCCKEVWSMERRWQW